MWKASSYPLPPETDSVHDTLPPNIARMQWGLAQPKTIRLSRSHNTGKSAMVIRCSAGDEPDRIYRPGELIGGEWVVLRVMEGGLGVVYAVYHREGGARCILKGPKGQSDPVVREAFRTEAETWVRLGDHTNIVHAHYVDEYADQLFVLAELVEADELNRVSLRDYLSAGPLRPAIIAAMTADFCHGLLMLVQKAWSHIGTLSLRIF
jgi:serine/threonine protein kinase